MIGQDVKRESLQGCHLGEIDSSLASLSLKAISGSIFSRVCMRNKIHVYDLDWQLCDALARARYTSG